MAKGTIDMRVEPELVNTAARLVDARTQALLELAGDNPAALTAVATVDGHMRKELSLLRTGRAAYLEQTPHVRSVVLLDETQRAVAALDMGRAA